MNPQLLIPDLKIIAKQFGDGPQSKLWKKYVGTEVRTIRTMEGADAVLEAIKFLESQEPVPSLRWDESMSKAARDHAEDLNYHTLVQHESSQYASIELMGKNDGVE